MPAGIGDNFFGLGLGALLLATPVVAEAQQPPREGMPAPDRTTAAQLPAAPPDARLKRGMLVGSFVLDAGAEVSAQYDDNIFATSRNKVDDIVTTVSPFLSLQSVWQKHEIKLDAGAAIGRYADRTSEDFEDLSAGIEGRYDLTGGSNLFAGARASREHESRESPDDVSGREPTLYRRFETFAGTLQRFGATSIRLGGTWQRYDFDDVGALGGSINNDDRDRDIFELGSRVGYRIGGGYEPFVQGAVNWRRYDTSVDDFGFDRESSGLGVAAGLRFEVAPGIDGEVLVGYLRQNYHDAAFDNRSALDFGGRLSWRLAPNTRTTFSVDRTLEETTIIGSSGYLNTTASVSIDHAIARDLVLSASASYSNADFAGLDRVDEMMGVGAGLKYFVTPNFYVGTDYRFIRRESNVAAANFDENLITLRLGAQLADGYRDAGSAPPQPSGFYGGLQAGFGQLGSELDGPRGAGTLSAEFADGGIAGGAFAGYGVTTNRWHFGLELEAEDGNAQWDHARLPGGRVYSVEKGASFGGALRLGRWLPYGALVYARAGIVRTEFDTEYQLASGMSFDRNDTKYGFRFGGGVEAPLSERFFLRMDYTHTSYQDYDVASNAGTDNFDNSESLFRLGVGYRLQDLPKAPDGSAEPTARFAGFYTGVQGGYGTLNTANIGPRDAGSTLYADRGGSGYTGGVFAGYGHLFGDVYLGVEVDASLSGMEWEIARDPTGRVYSVEQKESFGAAARLGYLVMQRALIYGRAGATRTRFNTKYAEGANFVDQDDTITGLRFGGGVEVPATDSLFLRFEYSVVTALNTYRVNYNSGVDSFEHDLSLFQVGIGYRF